MARSKQKSSSQWRRQQVTDGFVREAHRIGVRSRSYFKLQEIDRRFQLFERGGSVLDLGAAPGGWAQYATRRVGRDGAVFAADILSMAPVAGVKIIELDVTQEQAVDQLAGLVNGRSVDVVLSDIAPNITGNALIDAGNYARIYEAILCVCEQVLKKGGALVFKFFQHSEFAEYRRRCGQRFSSVTVYKPKSSRQRSPEAYLVAAGNCEMRPRRNSPVKAAPSR